MKARSENNVIHLYPTVPKTWKHWGNFDKADTGLLETQGFYDVVQPTTTTTQKLGAIYFDAEARIFTYSILERSREDLERSFNPQLCKDGLFLLFFHKLSDIALYYSILSDLVNDKGFMGISIYLTELRNKDIISEDEAAAVNTLFTNQNIDLTTYNI